MDEDAAVEVPLAGGHDSGRVARIGGTVRRAVRPWTPSVHAVLRHLESVGFAGAPRVIGFDTEGREVLTYIDGLDGRDVRCYSDAALIQVAHLIRSLHDGLRSFIPPADSQRRPDSRAPKGDLICHNDLSPANTIYRDGASQAFIDWDFAAPSTAVWDLSYAVRTFVPLYSANDCRKMGYEPEQRGELLRLFCQAYGMDAQTRRDLLPTVRTRLEGRQRHSPVAAFGPCPSTGTAGSPRQHGDGNLDQLGCRLGIPPMLARDRLCTPEFDHGQTPAAVGGGQTDGRPIGVRPVGALASLWR